MLRPHARSARPGALFVLALLGAALLAAPADAQGFGRNKIQYDGFDWHVLRTEHFDVYYYPEAEELAEIGAATAEEAYANLESRFDFSLTNRVPLIFYATNLHFKQTNITPGFIPDGVGGFFEFLKGRVVIPADGNIGRFRRVIWHEVAHVFTFNKLARVLRDHRRPTGRVLPLWFTEGLAEYWSGDPDVDHEMILRDAVASNFFVPLHDFDRIAGSFVMYKEGEAFCRFVAEEYGEERLLDLIEESWRDADFDRVIEVVLGEESDSVSDRWQAWVHEQYMPKVVDADVPSLVTEPVAAGGFNAKPAVYTRPDGSREVVFYSNRGSYTNVLSQPVDADLQPTGDLRVIVRGERNEEFEAFHLFESRMDVSTGGTLAVVTKRGGSDVVHLIDLETRERLVTLGFDELVAIYSPTLSPDSRSVAFVGIDRGGIADLYVYDLDGGPDGGGALRQLTHDVYDDRDPDFSPDGTRLVFSSDRTAWGTEGAFNLFTLDLASGAVRHVTAGPQVDKSPRWSPDGDRLAFVSARREADGKFSAQDLWLADLTPEPEAPLAAAEPAPGGGEEATPEPGPDARGPSSLAPSSLAEGGGAPDEPTTAASADRPRLRQLTRFTSAAFDPYWADSTHLVFTAFEDGRFTVRALDVDSLAAIPEADLAAGAVPTSAPWSYDRYDVGEGEEGEPYRRRYQLDFASGAFATTTTASASAGGATIAFSDLFGDDYIYVTAYSANSIDGTRGFFEGLNLAVTRVHLGRRANFGYGAFRLAGPRFDRTDPQQPTRIPSYETTYGVLGLVSYPISFFRRIDVESSFGLGRKTGLLRSIQGSGVDFDTLRTATLSNSISLIHDNALYSRWGPVEGTRANLSVGYTTDVWLSNESYYTLGADVRHYLRISPSVTFASWGLVRANVGRRARLNLLGGSWNLRGFPFLRVRGSKLWFTSHELRFPILNRPPLYPLLAGVRGALFVDAAHNWTDGYNDTFVDPDFPRLGDGELLVGTTKGSFGAGLRTSLFGAIVLRYDAGYRFLDGFDWSERQPFGQFFFGYDF